MNTEVLETRKSAVAAGPDCNLYYYLVNKVDGRFLDGEEPPRRNVYANSYLENDNQSWRFVPAEGDNEFYIINKVDGRYLDGEQPPRNNVYANKSLKNSNQTWSLISTGEINEFYIINNVNGRYLDGAQPPERNVYVNSPLKNDNQKWFLNPAGMKSEITFVGIDYKDAKYPTTGLGKVDFISNHDCINSGDVVVVRRFSKQVRETNTFEWGLKQTLMVGAEVEFKAGVPFGAGGATIKTELTLESHQKWTKTVEETYRYEEEVRVNPHESVSITGYMDWAENYETPYVLSLKVTMLADTVSGDDQRLSTADITAILKQRGCDGIITPQTDDESVVVALNGTFYGTYGMKSHTEVKAIS